METFCFCGKGHDGQGICLWWNQNRWEHSHISLCGWQLYIKPDGWRLTNCLVSSRSMTVATLLRMAGIYKEDEDGEDNTEYKDEKLMGKSCW